MTVPSTNFSADMIQAFKMATGDTNHIHPPYVMGFQLDGIAKRAAVDFLNNRDLVYAGQTMRFAQPIIQDEEVRFDIQKIGEVVEIRLLKDTIEAAAGKVYFVRPEELQEKISEQSDLDEGLEYVVNEEDVAGFHKGIGSGSPYIDPLFLVALASNRLIRYFQDFKIPEDKMAVFAKHEITVYGPITHVNYGDRFLLRVEGHNYKPGRPLFRVGLSATNPDSKSLYSVNFLLALDDRAKLSLQ